MEFVLLGVNAIVGLIALACFIMVIIKMFQNGDTGLGITCLVLLLACGLGVLVTFIMGWINVGKYGIANIMYAWTACIGIGMVLRIAFAAIAGG